MFEGTVEGAYWYLTCYLGDQVSEGKVLSLGRKRLRVNGLMRVG